MRHRAKSLDPAPAAGMTALFPIAARRTGGLALGHRASLVDRRFGIHQQRDDVLDLLLGEDAAGGRSAACSCTRCRPRRSRSCRTRTCASRRCSRAACRTGRAWARSCRTRAPAARAGGTRSSWRRPGPSGSSEYCMPRPSCAILSPFFQSPTYLPSAGHLIVARFAFSMRSATSFGSGLPGVARCRSSACRPGRGGRASPGPAP